MCAPQPDPSINPCVCVGGGVCVCVCVRECVCERVVMVTYRKLEIAYAHCAGQRRKHYIQDDCKQFIDYGDERNCRYNIPYLTNQNISDTKVFLYTIRYIYMLSSVNRGHGG